MCTKKKLDEKVHTLKQLKAEANALAVKIEAIENELKEEMTKKGVSELNGDDWQVTWNTYSSNRFDQSAFGKAHPDLLAKFKKLTESRKFVVK